jgi:CRP-like cAMP-binding protein
MSALEAFIRAKAGAEVQGLEPVLAAFSEMRVRRNDVLLIEGDICKHCYFIVKGALSLVSYNRNGDESITNFAFEQEWLTSVQSFVNRQAANERILALENSVLYKIDRDSFQRLTDTVPQFEGIYRELLESSYADSIQRVTTLLSLTATERVEWILQKYPLIFSRLPNKLIAAYIGVSPETLSRLKSRL